MPPPSHHPKRRPPTAAEITALRNRLARHGQEHVLRFWGELDAEAQIQLAAQLTELDLDLIARLYRDDEAAGGWKFDPYRAVPAPAFRLDDPRAAVAPEAARRRGEEALRSGRVAALVVAGGQGSRLGFEHPKGMFPIGPISQRSLFEVFVDRIRAQSAASDAAIPLLVMTSNATHAETVAFFAEHDRFGLAAEDLVVFRQGTMPAVDAATGKLLLSGRDSLFLSPDGHGGTLAALDRSGTLNLLARRGIEQVFYFQVDNPLAPVCDPALIGYHILSGSEMTSLVVRKMRGDEKVGVLVEQDGRVGVIEYSELPDEVAFRRDEQGQLYHWAGSIAIHVFELAFLQRTAHQADALPYHKALKKAAYLDEAGQYIEPEEPNAIKFERFIFDLMPHARRAVAVEGRAEDVFAAVKNASGTSDRETPEAVREAMIAQHARWLRAAGAEVAEGVAVEINPRFALDVDQLRQRIAPGTRITAPTYFQ